MSLKIPALTRRHVLAASGAGALAAIAAGLPGHILEKVFGAIAFAHEDTRTPMLTALAGLATAVAGAVLLFPHYGHVGIAAAIGISGWVGAALLGAILMQRRWLAIAGETWRRLPRIVLAAAATAIALALLHHALALIPGMTATTAGRIALMLVLVAGGLAFYILCLQATGVMRMRDLIAAVRSRV